MTRIHKTVLFLVAAIALVLGLTVSKVLNAPKQLDPAALADAGIILLPQSRALPALSLLDENGEKQAVDQLKGRWTLLFFGYTFCPDICPTTLAELRQLRSQLPPEVLERYRVTMVSVDPQRDTPEQLKLYLGYYKAGYSGLTGELADIQQLASAVSIPFIPGDTRQEHYTVDHSGNLALIGPDGRQRGFIRAPLNPAKLATQLPQVLRQE
jgi:protein SCO1/2